MASRGTTYSAATKMVAGLNSHRLSLRIVHPSNANTPPKDALQNAVNEAHGKETAYQTVRQGKSSAVAAQAEARQAVEGFCLQARNVLKPFLGRLSSEQWVITGFKNQSRQLPGTLADLVECLCSFKEYFAGHAAHENPMAGVPAALEPDDVRWLDFVDSLPADTQAPEAVSNLEVEGDGPGLLAAEWSPSLRAERYQVEVIETGRDVEFRRVTTVTEPNAEIEGLTPRARVKARVVAANAAGSSAPSEIVDAVVQPLANVA